MAPNLRCRFEIRHILGQSEIWNSVRPEGKSKMNYIEFLGPMGAGKSTLHRFLVKAIADDDMLRQQLADGAHLAQRSLYHQLPYSKKKNIIYKILYRAPWLRNRLFPPHDMAEVFGINPDCTALAEWIIKHYQGITDNPERSLKRYQLLYMNLGQYSAIVDSFDHHRTPVFDEFLLQRCIGFSLYQKDHRAFLEKCFSLTPLPICAVYVKVTPDVSYDRVMERSSSRQHFHQGTIIFNELDQHIKALLKKRQCQVIEINGTDSMRHNVEIILNTITKTLNANTSPLSRSSMQRHTDNVPH